jgi:hypothetical protein
MVAALSRPADFANHLEGRERVWSALGISRAVSM